MSLQEEKYTNIPDSTYAYTYLLRLDFNHLRRKPEPGLEVENAPADSSLCSHKSHAVQLIEGGKQKYFLQLKLQERYRQEGFNIKTAI